jgi:hypothetical protein
MNIAAGIYWRQCLRQYFFFRACECRQAVTGKII